jgi:TRAP-type transport system large permease protein
MLIAGIAFIILLALGMPVAFGIGIAGLLFYLTTPGVPTSILPQNIVAASQSFTLLAIPLFIFAGNLMNRTGITERLVVLASALTGHMYGSLGQVSTVLSTFMGGVSGSANADAAMQSRILGPEMTKRGYAKGYSAAVNGVTALITATIPPSMGLIIYGTVGEVSIGRLFAAGFVPGVMMMIALMIAVRVTAKRRGYMPEREKPASLREIGSAVGSSLWALGFPVLLLVGIRLGVFTPSESGAFACVYAIFVGVFVYKKLNLRAFIDTLKDTARDIGIVMILVAMSGTIGYGIVYDQVPQSLSELFIGITSNPTLMVLIAVVLLTLCGMFIETTVIALLLTPILVPAVEAVGVDPVHFGLVMMTATTMGIMTPPVGIALYTTSQIMGTSPQDTARQSLPFLFAAIVVLLIMVVFPDLVLFVPDLVFGS